MRFIKNVLRLVFSLLLMVVFHILPMMATIFLLVSLVMGYFDVMTILLYYLGLCMFTFLAVGISLVVDQ